MRFLRTNTPVIVTVGPFYDKTDGVTIEGALTITNERITLTADTDAGSAPTIILDNIAGATAATANDLNYITGIDAGLMQLELSAADTNRLGRMMLTITDAVNHVPVFHEFMVLPANVYDSLVLGSDLIDAEPSATGVRAAVGLAAANLDTQLSTIDDFLDTEVAAIKTKTDNLPVDPASQAAVLAKLPSALIGGRMDSTLSAIGNDTTALTAFKRAVLGNVIGTVTIGATTTSIPTSALTPAGTDADQFKGRILTFDKDTTTAALRGQATDITANTASATPTFTVTLLTTAPVSGDTFTIT